MSDATVRQNSDTRKEIPITKVSTTSILPEFLSTSGEWIIDYTNDSFHPTISFHNVIIMRTKIHSRPVSNFRIQPGHGHEVQWISYPSGLFTALPQHVRACPQTGLSRIVVPQAPEIESLFLPNLTDWESVGLWFSAIRDSLFSSSRFFPTIGEALILNASNSENGLREGGEHTTPPWQQGPPRVYNSYREVQGLSWRGAYFRQAQ